MAFIQKSLVIIETLGDFSNGLEGSHHEDFLNKYYFLLHPVIIQRLSQVENN